MFPEFTAAIQALGSILQFGLSTRDAWKEKGFSKDDLGALGALFGTGDSVLKLKNKKTEDKDLGAQHLAIVAACFGHALKQTPLATHAPFQNISQPRPPSDPPEQNLNRILTNAAQARLAPGQMPAGKAEFDLISSLIGNPLATPYYQFLWDAFTTPVEQTPPLLQLPPGQRLRFESAFLIAWGHAMASETGEHLRHYIDTLQGDYKPALIYQLLTSDMSDWGSRHTFGNTIKESHRKEDPLPFMPLEEMYVEPSALSAPQEQGPILHELNRLLKKHNTIIIQGDFGTGKSLTARMLACSISKTFRDGSRPSTDLTLPVYIRSADDLKPQDLSIENTVRHALRRHANNLGLSLKLNDPSLRPPEDNQHTLFLIDGLDEVHLGERGLNELFENIKAEATDRHRFIIFSRPGALPSRREVRALENVPFLHIMPWNAAQIDDWLRRWSGVSKQQGPSRAEINSRGLGELAQTPILLLMIAHTWNTSAPERNVSKAELYELFFQSIARGKHVLDKDAHPAVFEASTKLKDNLAARHIIAQDAGPSDAMLWLMSRVAWETVRLEHRGLAPLQQAEILTKGDVRILLNKELGFRSEATTTAESIQVGLLLALQVNLHADNASQILFGHKSFREFLVARYWADRLKAICREDAEPEDSEGIKKSLLGGRLLGTEDQSFSFLMEMLNSPNEDLGLNAREREELFRWLEAQFRDERWLGNETQVRLRDDQSAWLREAALAIGSCLYLDKGLRQRDPFTIRSMTAWFWLTEVDPIITAPRAHLEGAQLSGLTLHGANLENANLRKADCAHAALERANLENANLEHARLQGADLTESNLRKANLRKASLNGAVLEKANLEEADLENSDAYATHFSRANLSKANLSNALLLRSNFREANLERADLSESSLEDSDLRRAILTRAKLHKAMLEEANLDGANLQEAELQRAILKGANLRGANLQDANLQGANLRGTNLRGANLQGANLQDADLQGAIFQDALLEGADLLSAQVDQSTDWTNASPNLIGTIHVEDESGDSNVEGTTAFFDADSDGDAEK